MTPLRCGRVAISGNLRANRLEVRVKHALAAALLAFVTLGPSHSFADECPSNWKSLHPEWIWCDDFETNKLSSYYDNDSPALLARTAEAGFNGSFGMVATWPNGATNAGSLKLAFGLSPGPKVGPPPAGVDNTTKFREIYYRLYLKTNVGWVNPPDPPNKDGNSKLSRAMIMDKEDWSQAMIAHLWSDENANRFLLSDPAGCVTNTTVDCSGYNDFGNLDFLGATRGVTPIFVAPHLGVWKCIEHHVKLNDAGQSNGISEFWIDGNLEGRKTDLNYVSNYDNFGINSIFLENFINHGASAAQSRVFDNFVVSTQRIGCGPSAAIAAPTNLRVN
jgi:hypothetical protein